MSASQHACAPRALSAPTLLAVGLLAICLPVALVRFPALLDYANHLARLWLLSGGIHEGPLSQIYAIDWGRARTNIGIDALVMVLGAMLPIEIAGSLLVALTIVLPPLGAIALNRSLFNDTNPCRLIALFFGLNILLLYGFLNFVLGMGLALLAGALEPRLGTSARAWLVRAVMGAVVLATHLLDFALYVGLVFFLRLPQDLNWRTPLRDAVAAISGASFAALTAAFAFLPYILLSRSMPGGEGAMASGIAWNFQPAHKLSVALIPFITYYPPLDIVLSAAVLAPLAWALWTGRLQVHRGLLAYAIVLGAAAMLAPEQLAATGYIDSRAPVAAVLVLLAGTRIDIETERARSALAGLILSAVAAKSALVAAAWIAQAADIGAVLSVARAIPPKSVVIPIMRAAPDARTWSSTVPFGRYMLWKTPTFSNYPVLAVIRQHAFSPLLFTAIGKQPVRVLAPFDEIALPEGLPWSLENLAQPETDVPVIRQWKTRVDYVIEMAPGRVPVPLASQTLPELELIAAEGFARLYRVRKP